MTTPTTDPLDQLEPAARSWLLGAFKAYEIQLKHSIQQNNAQADLEEVSRRQAQRAIEEREIANRDKAREAAIQLSMAISLRRIANELGVRNI